MRGAPAAIISSSKICFCTGVSQSCHARLANASIASHGYAISHARDDNLLYSSVYDFSPYAGQLADFVPASRVPHRERRVQFLNTGIHISAPATATWGDTLWHRRLHCIGMPPDGGAWLIARRHYHGRGTAWHYPASCLVRVLIITGCGSDLANSLIITNIPYIPG